MLFLLILQTLFIPWFFGIDKLSALLTIRTEEKIPKFFVFVCKVFVPVFSVVIFIISLIDDFTDDFGTADGYTGFHYTFAKLIWVFPVLLVGVLAFKPLETQENFDELVIHQYGIRFKPTEKFSLKSLVCNSAEYDIVNQRTFDKRSYAKAVAAWNKSQNEANLKKAAEGTTELASKPSGGAVAPIDEKVNVV